MTDVLSAIATWFNGLGHAMQSHIELRNGVPHLVTQNTDTGEPAAAHAIESDIVKRLAQWQPEVGKIVGEFLDLQGGSPPAQATVAQPSAAAPPPAAPAAVSPAPATPAVVQPSTVATPDASAAARPADVVATDRARRVAQLVAGGIDEALANRVVDVEGPGGTA